MRRGNWRIVLLVLTILGLSAWSRAYAAETCEQLKARCAAMTDWEIFDAAYLWPDHRPTSLGACYVHDRLSCPDCACHFYVKESYKPEPKGYDDPRGNGRPGTGCIPPYDNYSQARLAAIAVLREECLKGACCCPNLAPAACPLPGPVAAKDSLTGMCCTFPNPCTIPSGWTQQAFGCP